MKTDITMIFEAGFYLETPVARVPPETIMGFAQLFGKHLDAMSVTDVNLRDTKVARPSAKLIGAAQVADSPPRLIYLFEKAGRPDPAYDLGVSRLPAQSKADEVTSLFATMPAAHEHDIGAELWRLAAESGFKSGTGIIQRAPKIEICYAQMFASVPDDPNAIWEDFSENCDRYMGDAASFRPVCQGKMLRSVMRQNFMTVELADRIEKALAPRGLGMAKTTALPNDRLLWTVPESDDQRAAHAVLLAAGLVWERSWIDIEAYVPEDQG